MLTRSPLSRAGRIIVDTDQKTLLEGLAPSLVSLQCEKLGCESHVVLLLVVKREDGDAWALGNMTVSLAYPPQCAKDFRVLEPIEFRGSLRWPNE